MNNRKKIKTGESNKYQSKTQLPHALAMSLILTYCRFELSPKALLCSLPSGAQFMAEHLKE